VQFIALLPFRVIFFSMQTGSGKPVVNKKLAKSDAKSSQKRTDNAI
jgi:hypothetical protein